MDTNKEYIKMCAEAKEIQRSCTIKKFDLFYIDFSNSGWKNDNEVVVADSYYDKECKEFWYCPYFLKEGYSDARNKGMRYVWLPRQDQLQEMVDEPIGFAIEHFYGLQEFGDPFHCYTGNVDDKGYWKSMKTMEQLWLAFVMKEKYNKHWDGNKWIK